MEDIFVDVAVIGAGPAGQKAAIQCVKLGRRTLVIDKQIYPGGACLSSGTIPSKSLREAIIDYTNFYLRGFQNIDHCVKQEITIQDLNNRLGQVILDERNMIARQFHRNHVRFIQEGKAHFKTPHVLLVSDELGNILYRIKAKNYIIGTGSKPRQPINVPFDDDVILDSSSLLKINKIPKTMLVLGGGIIGSEYASFFAALGTRVTIADKKDHILPFIDSEIGIHLQTALTELGLKFLRRKSPAKIERIENRAVVTFDDGMVAEADVLLFALGRTANVDELEIANAGIELNDKGYVVVNNNFQTSASHIYAVGDVVGGPCLASTSMEQGRLAARHVCRAESKSFPETYPIGIYTIPEISSTGYTEDELKSMGYHYEVGRAYYYEIARSHIAGSHTGLLKIIFHSETLEVLGVHVIGRGATEVVHIGQVAMLFNAKIDFFINQVFNYPTYAETYRVAALNGLNKIEGRKRR